MTRELASELMVHFRNATRELEAILLVADQCDVDERRRYITAIAGALTAMLDICNPALMEHPDLDVDGILPRKYRAAPKTT